MKTDPSAPADAPEVCRPWRRRVIAQLPTVGRHFALVIGLLLCTRPFPLAAADLAAMSPSPTGTRLIAAFPAPPTTPDGVDLNFGNLAVGQMSSICLKACSCSDVNNCTCDRSGTWNLVHGVAAPFSAFNYRVQSYVAGHPNCALGTPVQLPVNVAAGQELTFTVQFAPTAPGTYSDYLTLSDQAVTMAGSASGAAQCQESATVLCLDNVVGDARFRVTVSYSTSEGSGLSGQGQAVSLDLLGIDHGGLFWFFAAGNPEMLVKVLNGCAANDRFWVFFAAMTNVGFTVTVTDTSTGTARTYRNTDLTSAVPVQDTAAFACP